MKTSLQFKPPVPTNKRKMKARGCPCLSPHPAFPRKETLAFSLADELVCWDTEGWGCFAGKDQRNLRMPFTRCHVAFLGSDSFVKKSRFLVVGRLSVG